MSGAIVLGGDCLQVLRDMESESVHAVITDPPYGLSEVSSARLVTALTAWANGDREHVPDGRGFMGKAWDAFVPPPAVWDECLRVLRPGGHLAVFAGSRTVDLMGLSIRLAGFEMRDGIAAWLYGSGFPKGINVGKAIDKVAGGDDARRWSGWNTALKPAHEPILLARKPLAGTVARNVVEHGTGAINVDACRVATPDSLGRPYGGGNEVYGTFSMPRGTRTGDELTGRWPTNVLFAHHPDCGPDCEPDTCVDECQVAALDEQSGTTTSKSGGRTTNALGQMNDDAWVAKDLPRTGHDDTGGASRFFPTFRYQAKAPKRERPKVDGVAHPTVKPLGLMTWLVKLLCPPGGTVLDPFAGSGTTLQAATEEGFASIGIERDPDYLKLINARLGFDIAQKDAA